MQLKYYRFLIKIMMCISLFLGLGIGCKSNSTFKSFVQKKIYQEYLDFSSIKVFYDKYLGGFFPIESISNSGLKAVFNENLVYEGFTKYEDGVELVVDYNYLVPVIESGMIVYLGEKEKYGKVVIVEGDNGIDIWYGNLDNVTVNIYDRVEKGSYLGNIKENKLYLVYTKDQDFLNYNDYLN